MKTATLITVLFTWVILNSFQCNKNIPNPCSVYKHDTALLNHTLPNIKTTFKTGDTVKIEALVPDDLPVISGGTIAGKLDQLYLNLQPYSIVKNNTLPELRYANIEFNPWVEEGQLVTIGTAGYNFLYKRVNSSNSIKIGFIAGRAGLYAFECSNYRYAYGGAGLFTLTKPSETCTTYWGVSNIASSVQNLQYWDSLGVNTVALPAQYGVNSISKNTRNYFLFKVIP